MVIAAIMLALALLAYFAKVYTLRCRLWGAITFSVLFGIGILLNVYSMIAAGNFSLTAALAKHFATDASSGTGAII